MKRILCWFGFHIWDMEFYRRDSLDWYFVCSRCGKRHPAKYTRYNESK